MIALQPPPLASTASSFAEWSLFRHLLPTPLLNDLDPKATQTAYTPWVVTWLLVYQRLNGNATLNDAVSEFLLRFPQHAQPDCKRIRDQSLSANTGAYSRARSALKITVTNHAADHIFDSLVDTYPPSWLTQRVFILDGSTIPLAPTPELRKAFPPARNQYGESHWPILHLAVAHELSSGLGVIPEHGAMYGPNAVSELTLAERILERLPKHSVVLSDRNFGVFGFAHATVNAGHDLLFRMTEVRFRALVKKAREVQPGVWELNWTPSKNDRKKHPNLPTDAMLSVRLHEVRVSDRLTLWLVTTLEGSGNELANLYHRRQDVETDIRNLKVTLKLDQIRGKTVDVVAKELAAGMMACNLANQVRRLAAKQVGIDPRCLSFAGVWSLLKTFVTKLGDGCDETQAQADFERMLRMASQRRLPQREPNRSYPRELIFRRRKFPERKRQEKVVASQ